MVFGTIQPTDSELRTVKEEKHLETHRNHFTHSTSFSSLYRVRANTKAIDSETKTNYARATQTRIAGADRGRTRVADQIKFLTQVYLLAGGVTSGIAAVDEAARRNEASRQSCKRTAEQSEVKTSIQGFREGLDKLEIDFRTTPELQPYYIKLAGVAAGAATAEEQAAANQFDRGRQNAA